jgi:hypothetical protein
MEADSQVGDNGCCLRVIIILCRRAVSITTENV